MRLPRILLFIAAAVLFAAQSASAQTCPGANPNDWSDDTSALDACFSAGGDIVLVPGNPGYLVSAPLTLANNTTRLTSVGGKARIVAQAGLNGSMISIDTTNFEISELLLDGNKGGRDPSICVGNGQRGQNMSVRGDSFTVHHIDTVNALCGSGLVLTGSNYDVYSIFAADNGYSQDEYPAGAWSDGITVLRCDGGSVHDSWLQNNTDVDLVIFKGIGCTIRNNQITNDARFAFAGLKVGDPGQDSSVSLAGSLIHDNTVSSGYNLLSFGVLVGHHPWNSGTTISDVGEVSYNSSTGAVVNLAVDGIGAGTVINNSASGAQGNRGYHCGFSANYTAAHWGSASVQGGWDALWQYDNGTCGPA